MASVCPYMTNRTAGANTSRTHRIVSGCITPPAWVIDKRLYSPWTITDLHPRLRQAGIDTLVITGGETEVCVMATMIGAIDLGYRVVLATDALCSSADETHDAMLRVYESRFGMQVETAETEEILDAWR